MKGLEKIRSQEMPLSNGPALRAGCLSVEYDMDRGVICPVKGKMFEGDTIDVGCYYWFMWDYSSEIITGKVYEIEGKLFAKTSGLDYCELFVEHGQWQRTAFSSEREETPDR